MEGMDYAELTVNYKMTRAGIVNALYKYKLRYGLMLARSQRELKQVGV